MILSIFHAGQYRALTSLDILGNNIGEEQANKLVQVLNASDTLKTLCGFTGTETEIDLSNRDLSASCAILVANEVKVHRLLRKIIWKFEKSSFTMDVIDESRDFSGRGVQVSSS